MNDLSKGKFLPFTVDGIKFNDRKAYNERLKSDAHKMAQLIYDIYKDVRRKSQQQVTDPEQDMMSFEDFLNVVVDDQNVVDYQIREPFRTYFRMHSISSGRGDRT